ncbi:MAG TPA: hypothetical protein VF765_14565, partial [Polyangiaceae bacterium]
MGRNVRALVALAASAGIGACALSRAGLSNAVGDAGGPGGDASPPLDAAADGPRADAPGPEVGADDAGDDVGSPDVTSTDAGSTGTVTITGVGTVANATGLSSGVHLVYATHTKLWWLFWIDSTQPQTIQTSYSPDFVHWTAGGSLPLLVTLLGQGGNLSVAYADVQGADVVHLSIGGYAATEPKRHHLHARALVQGTTITFGSVADMADVPQGSDTDPDGPATFVDSQGTVWDATGWSNATGGVGNDAIAASTSIEQGGATWGGMFGAQSNVYSAMGNVHSRAFATAGANLLVALCDAADQAQPSNVEWMTWSGAAWSGPTDVFAGGKTQATNDWGVATLSDGHMHVARRATDGSFDHVRYDGAAWTTLAAPPADTLGWATGQGVVVLASGTNPAIVTIAGDTANSVRMITWTGTAWGQWTTLEGTTASRGWVSGWSGAK